MIRDIKRHWNRKGVKRSLLIISLINVFSFFISNGFSLATFIFSIVGVFAGFLIFSWGFDNPEEGENYKKYN